MSSYGRNICIVFLDRIQHLYPGFVHHLSLGSDVLKMFDVLFANGSNGVPKSQFLYNPWLCRFEYIDFTFQFHWIGWEKVCNGQSKSIITAQMKNVCVCCLHNVISPLRFSREVPILGWGCFEVLKSKVKVKSENSQLPLSHTHPHPSPPTLRVFRIYGEKFLLPIEIFASQSLLHWRLSSD